MRIGVLLLGIASALALALGASLPMGLMFANRSNHGAHAAGSAVDFAQIWAVSGPEDGLQRISAPPPGISSRRVITDPGIDTPLTLSADGRRISVTGHVGCTSGESYEIQTSVTQSSTGALARGRTQGRCSGRVEQFQAPTWVYDEALFAVGPAQACGLLITRSRVRITDAFQWCRKEDVALVTASSSY